MKEKHVYEYLDKNEYETYCSFFVANSHAQTKYIFAQHHGLDFKEELGDCSVKILRCFDKYIREGEVEVDMFNDEYWIKALYSEGGYFSFPNFDEDEYEEQKDQPLEIALQRGRRFDENCCITLPKMKKHNHKLAKTKDICPFPSCKAKVTPSTSVGSKKQSTMFY